MENNDWKETLEQEAATWNLTDPEAKAEKIERERVRYPKLIKDLQLNLLDLFNKSIVEIGSGPISLLSLLQAKYKYAIDPLVGEYAKFHSLARDIEWMNEKGESTTLSTRSIDLCLISNALDHTESPLKVITEVIRILKPSGYFAVISCINNAITNPHPAHKINLDLTGFHQMVDPVFETCWELNYDHDGYRYGWRLWRGKRGTPAFAWLGRKCTDYGDQK